MALRRDALAASAHIVTWVERICRELSGLQSHAGGHQEDRDSHSPLPNLQPAASDPPPQTHLVCTVGSLQPHPDASNVIAGRVRLTLDVRSDDDAVRRSALDRIRRASEALCDARGVSCTLMQVHEADAVSMDPGVREVLSEAAKRAVQATRGADGESESLAPIVVPTLTSGAGHDAMALAPVFPSAMLFVRDREGVSHSPLEHVEGKDVAVGARALFETLVWHAATVGDDEPVVSS
ncbi:hypothetical protein H632_c166p1 [Helicosporidium sp. ATCC 50920]|nr:hypothetical protein H632_c166p1 [Helicosporidium sp. ATCC 50920]|eukprot:KDD76601.1 hypothetical protein H632_c166p1 [Helicosporidium sp. ATCC 50920]